MPPIKFISNKIIRRASKKIVEAENLALPSPAPQAPALAPGKPTPEEVGHGYGLGDPNHRLLMSTSMYGRNNSISRGTPEWEKFSQRIDNAFQGKVTPDEFLKAYSLPNAERQALTVGPGYHGPNSMGITYQGSPVGAGGTDFNYRLEHLHDNYEGNHVKWDSMYNNTDNPRVFPETMKRLFEMYPKAGINSIRTLAMSNNSMNGAHTWGNLGFGWEDKGEKQRVLEKMHELEGGNWRTPISPDLEKVEYPFDLMNYIKEQKAKGGFPESAKEIYRRAFAKADDGYGDYDNEEDDNPDSTFRGILRLHPQDRGFQRANTLIRRMLKQPG